MKSKTKIIIIVMVVMLLLTGCTKQLKDANGKIVETESTGQKLPENILCQPTHTATLETYEKVKQGKLEKYDQQLEEGEIGQKEYDKKIASILDIESLPKCENFKVTSGGYEGIWTSIFVKPLAWFLIKIGILVKNYGLAIILTTILIRLVIFPFTKKSLNQSESLAKARPELDKLEKKYKDRTDRESSQMKAQEMLAIYKKYDIKPLSGCLLSFLQIPLFFAYYEALNRLPALFEDSFLGYKLNTTPLVGITNGNYLYLLLPVVVLLVTYFSLRMNNTSLGDQQKQMKTMFNVMIIIIFVTSFSLSSAIVIYWIASSGFTIIQNLLVKKVGKKHDKRI